MTHDGLKVLLVEPDFAEEPSLSLQRGLLVHKQGHGSNYVQFGDAVRETQNMKFVLSGDDILDLDEFFHRAKGKWATFLIPSWSEDLTLAEDVTAGQSAISIEAVGYDAAFLQSSDPTEFGLRIFMLDTQGNIFIANVLSAETDGELELLGLDRELTSDFQVGDAIVGFVKRVRFVNDELEWEFNGPDIASTSLAVREVVVVSEGSSS